MILLLLNSKALLLQQELCDAAVNFICVPKFTVASRGPPCDSVASRLYYVLYYFFVKSEVYSYVIYI